MKKTLLIAAAALAAGVISSQAQVYSQNIVGYVNTPAPAGYLNIANPLDNASGNSLTNLFQNAGGALDGVLVYLWNGTGYTIDQFDSQSPSGMDNSGGSAIPVAPIVNPGQMIYVWNNTGVGFTNTFVGTVHVEGAGTGSVGVTTNNLLAGYNFVASKISIGGGITSTLQVTNTSPGGPGNGVLDGVLIYVPHILANGNFAGYTISQFDSTSSTGFDTSGGAQGAPEPIIPVGTGAIIFNNSGATYPWVQSL
jgi:hypothetical protein